MALPTTRRGRYVFRQNRYRRKSQRAWRNRQRVERYVGGLPVFRRAGNWTLKGDGRRQLPPGRRPERGAGPLHTLPLGRHLHFTPANRDHPPFVALHVDLIHTPVFAGVTNARRQILGYGRRRVKWRGRKLFPLTDGRRKPRAISYANRFFAGNGFYPLWDPLGRLPNG